jgi:hypothetical protein
MIAALLMIAGDQLLILNTCQAIAALLGARSVLTLNDSSVGWC